MKNISGYKPVDPEKEPEKIRDGSALRVGILALGEYRDITDKLIRAAVGVFLTHRVSEAQMRIMWSPNAFTLPLLARSMARSGEFDGIVVLGALIKDDTDKYYFEGSEICRALMDAMMDSGVPVGSGLLYVQSRREALRLAGKKDITNPATRAAVDLVELMLD